MLIGASAAFTPPARSTMPVERRLPVWYFTAAGNAVVSVHVLAPLKS